MQLPMQPWKGFCCQEGRGSAALGRTAGKVRLAADIFSAVVFLCREEGELRSLCAYSLVIASSLDVKHIFHDSGANCQKGTKSYTVKFQEKDKTTELFCPF